MIDKSHIQIIISVQVNMETICMFFLVPRKRWTGSTTVLCIIRLQTVCFHCYAILGVHDSLGIGSFLSGNPNVSSCFTAFGSEWADLNTCSIISPSQVGKKRLSSWTDSPVKTRTKFGNHYEKCIESALKKFTEWFSDCCIQAISKNTQ